MCPYVCVCVLHVVLCGGGGGGEREWVTSSKQLRPPRQFLRGSAEQVSEWPPLSHHWTSTTTAPVPVKHRTAMSSHVISFLYITN